MKVAELTGGQQRLLEQFESAGGVAKFKFFEADSLREVGVDLTAHLKAVLAGMREIQRDVDDWAERTAVAHQIPRKSMLSICINDSMATKMTPTLISCEQFLGPRFDSVRKGLIVRGKDGFLNEFFFYKDEARRENIIPADKIDDGIGCGFAYAFSSPPYGLTISREEVGELFDKFLKFVLFVSAESTIYQWPTDWTNFFDDGREWWGSFLWSISNPYSPQIIVIAASATD